MISFSGIRLIPVIALSLLTTLPCALGQSLDSPMTQLRPIGEPSAVDRYRGPAETANYRQTAYQQAGAIDRAQVQQAGTSEIVGSGVRQTVMQQPFAAPQLPAVAPGSFAPPTLALPPPPPNSVVMPPSAPRGLPSNGNLMPVPANQSVLVPSTSDFAPLAQPELSNAFSTIDNCNCVTAPSSYSAASSVTGCAPVSYQAPATYAAQAPIAAPTILPNGVAGPQVGGAPAGTLVTFGQQTYPVEVGQGWLGQPVAYVPGQPIRNWFRYIFP